MLRKALLSGGLLLCALPVRCAVSAERRALMDRLRAAAEALREKSERLEQLASAHAQDRPPPPADDRGSLRASAARGAQDLRDAMEEYWRLDSAERLLGGVRLAGELLSPRSPALDRVGESQLERIREVADLGDFPKAMESAYHRADRALAAEETAFEAARRRRERGALLRTGLLAAGAAAVLLLGAAAWVFRPAKTG